MRGSGAVSAYVSTAEAAKGTEKMTSFACLVLGAAKLVRFTAVRSVLAAPGWANTFIMPIRREYARHVVTYSLHPPNSLRHAPPPVRLATQGKLFVRHCYGKPKEKPSKCVNARVTGISVYVANCLGHSLRTCSAVARIFVVAIFFLSCSYGLGL